MKSALLTLLFLSVHSLFCQQKLYLQNQDKPTQLKEVVLVDIRFHTLDGTYYELENPVISEGWVISGQDSIALLEITDIRCATRAKKWEKGAFLLAAAGVVGFTAGGISFVNEVWDSATSLNKDNQFPLAITGILAGSAAMYIGYKYAGFARRYQVRDTRWKLIIL